MTINALALPEVIIKAVVWYYGVLDSIVSDRALVFISKFWSSLCYILEIKQRLSTTFQPQINGQTDKQNSTMETNLQAFVNYNQDDWARFFPIAKFAYNNAINASTGHVSLKLNCGFHPKPLTKKTSILAPS